MLIRELDFLFDEWRHGSWVYFALVIAMIASYKGFLEEGLELWGYLLALVAVLRHYVRVSKDHSS